MVEPSTSLPVVVAAPPRPGRITRLFAALGPDFTLFFAFLALFLTLGVIYGASFHIWEGSIFLAVGATATLIGARFVFRARAIVADAPGARAAFRAAVRGILRDWGALILVTVVFENLHNFTGVIRKIPIDDQLYRMDVRLFGVEPTVWAGRFANPILTDYMSFAYGLYFILPMILAVMLSFRGRRHDFRELATCVVLHMCLGFLLFIVFPAGPPRFYEPLLHGQFQPPRLASFLGLFEWSQDVWDTANHVKAHSSFPSMHCCIALITLFYAWRFGDAVWPRARRAFFWLCVPLVVSLWVSTVYLRHHWVPDCAAGWILAIGCYAVTPWLRRNWPRPVKQAEEA
jgi:membrane-associated phospholipid phosphatase